MKRLGIELIVCFVSIVLLIHSANALSVGAFRSTKEKTVFEGETARFTINFFNLGTQPVIVNLKVETPLHVEYPDGQKIILKPSSSITDSDGWFHLKGNQYVKTKRLSFDVQAPYVDQDSTYTIKALAEIHSENSSANSEIYQKAVEVIEYTFKLNVKKKMLKHNETIQSGKKVVKPNITQTFYKLKSEDNKESKSGNSVKSIKVASENSTTKTSKRSITGDFLISLSSLATIPIFTLIAIIIIIARGRF